ncbi:hypothetical protein HDU67_009746 [Dinochytrium kinnereticum]|nr:hypothetical protein HDU67_009746 [Dinochytrium kinnereticum]
MSNEHAGKWFPISGSDRAHQTKSQLAYTTPSHTPPTGDRIGGSPETKSYIDAAAEEYQREYGQRGEGGYGGGEYQAGETTTTTTPAHSGAGKGMMERAKEMVSGVSEEAGRIGRMVGEKVEEVGGMLRRMEEV